VIILAKCDMCKQNVWGGRYHLEDDHYVCGACYKKLKKRGQNRIYKNEAEKKFHENQQKEKFIKEHEKQMNSVGYFKGEMCPFTQVNVGRETVIGGYGGGEYYWQHTACMKEYCAIWDNKNKRCSIKTIALNSKK